MRAKGKLWVTDPSPEQLSPIISEQPNNVTVLPYPADKIQIDVNNKLDAIWTRGAMQHAENKVQAFKLFHQYSKPYARLLVFDVFANTRLADYFDEHVATTCTTGHEVSFLTQRLPSKDGRLKED